MKFTYCPICGEKLIERNLGDEGLVRFCTHCDVPHFDSPSSCVEVLVINEYKQIVLLKQNYISKTHWTLVTGYVKNGDTLEETVVKEVLEETGQVVDSMQYVSSYYIKQRELIMAGFIVFVNSRPFIKSKEVDDIMWCELQDVKKYISANDILSGTHFDKSMKLLGL